MAIDTTPTLSSDESTPDIPGLSDLLVSAYRFKDPERVMNAAENVRQPILNGIRGMGTLLWWASQHESFGATDFSRSAIGDVGLLLELLGDMADATSIIGINASTTHGINEAAARAGSDKGEFVSVPVVGSAR
ncbi:hypothetical protein FQY83_02925 [Luteimonas marina]|uniref:Uncharacterized protein n=1 Tax=Luteimonas marina TaxID=488485 RepID=A0A5C5UCI6_9GAMM|nr:hypothetical protein [Luteimonas marina]TWT23598.1 hypothetical protein FQY83_02925 [Luteimonas marina]